MPLSRDITMRYVIPEAPPVIAPVSPVIVRPRWSVMIPVFNCGGFLELTLQSVLCQDRGQGAMQIEVVDDASSDTDVKALVAAVGKGRIGYFRQDRNVGSVLNFHTCLQRARGHLIHILHGDDLVRPGFYQKQEHLFEKYPEAGAAFTRFAYVDEVGSELFCQDPEMNKDGILQNWLCRLSQKQRIQYAAMVVRREVYEKLGGFYGVEYGEDWEMWVRIAAHYRVAYTPDVLAEYRRHSNSISGQAQLTARNMECLHWVMQRIQAWLPEHERDKVLRESRRFYARYALRTALSLWVRFRNRRGAFAQARAAWQMNRDLIVLCDLIKLYTRITLNL